MQLGVCELKFILELPYTKQLQGSFRIIKGQLERKRTTFNKVFNLNKGRGTMIFVRNAPTNPEPTYTYPFRISVSCKVKEKKGTNNKYNN